VLPDIVADSARCMGLCAHSIFHSTMPARELSAYNSEETVAIELYKLEPCADIMSGERCMNLL